MRIKSAQLLRILSILIVIGSTLPSLVSGDIFDPGSNSSGGIFSGIGNGLEGIFSGFSGILPGGSSISSDGTSITVRAKGSYSLGGWTKMQLWVDGRLINTWEISHTDYRDYSAYLPEKNIAPEKVEVHFINDAVENDAQGNIITDRNLTVDYIVIGSTKIESENQPPVYKAQIDPCGVGGGGEILACNGCFNYGGVACLPFEQNQVVEDIPPLPDNAKQVKLTLEWDTLSLGGEGAQVTRNDPLFVEHQPWIGCPQCGSSEIIPNLSSLNYSPTDLVYGGTGQVLSASPPGNDNPPPAPAPPGPENPDPQPNPAQPPTIWINCPNQSDCYKANVEHVLTGWCGKDPIIKNQSRIFSEVPINSPGPNIFSLPGTISNKYIRRDGYAFSCLRDCSEGQCETQNYVEFQTEVYPSNALSLFLNVENISSLAVKNVLVDIHTLTYDPSGETPFPHNIDYPLPISGDNSIDFEYRHGNALTNADMQRIGALGGVPVSIAQETDPHGRIISKLVLGPMDLAPEEVKKIPLQPLASEYTYIPGAANPFDSGEVGVVNPVKPCECQEVRLHDYLGAGSCSETISAPTNDQCRLYYGIGVPDGSHAGGAVCDNGGIPVNGCPAPWCFEGAQSTSGPMDQCPDLDGDGRGDKIPNPADTNPNWYYFDTENKNPITEFLAQLLPDFITEKSPVNPPTVEAYGCQNPCQNNAPPSILGQGGILPRDYNFVCDQTDPEERERCLGQDPDVMITNSSNQFGTYRDVTGLGGCGYQASSNNSVIGPLQITAQYGGEGDNRTSRSVLLASVPIGGRLSDDQARPYGWPTNGKITQDWGYTGEADAQGSYRSNPTQDYGEFRYCVASSGGTPPPAQPTATPTPTPATNLPTATPTPVGGVPAVINCDVNAPAPDPSKNNILPIENLIAVLDQKFYTSYSEEHVRLCYNDLINRAIAKDIDPAFMMTIWLEESGASDYTAYGNVADFGCVGNSNFPRQNFDRQATCMSILPGSYQSYKSCRVPPSELTVEKFLQIFSGGTQACTDNNYGTNPQFPSQVKRVYGWVSNGAQLNDNCILPSTRWDASCKTP